MLTPILNQTGKPPGHHAHPGTTDGDFNHADLKTVLPKLHQHVDFLTRGDNILDLVYTTFKGACKATTQTLRSTQTL